MSAPLRSDGWSVRPSFVPHGAVTPVTLLADENALTQLAGVPTVAWQTPWSELSNIQFVRFARGMALFATAAGVRYCWRNPSRNDFEPCAPSSSPTAAWSRTIAAAPGLQRRARRVDRGPRRGYWVVALSQLLGIE